MRDDTNDTQPAGVGPVERSVGRLSDAKAYLLLTVNSEAHETLRTLFRCSAVCLAVYIVVEALKAWAGVH